MSQLNPEVEKTSNARIGRSNQVYSPKTGARVVAGCIPLNEQRTKVIMISSSKHKDRWVLPKGGVESDEMDNFAATAKRETWEEAGITGIITKKLKVIQDHRFMDIKDATKVKQDLVKLQDDEDEIDENKIPRTEYHFFEMEVDELSFEWPESKRRMRKWCTYIEAKHELMKSNRPELIEALNDSNIAKDSTRIEVTDSGMIKDSNEKVDDY